MTDRSHVKPYFKLSALCYLVAGSENGCIYNLSTGDMLAIDRDKFEVLHACERNERADQFPEEARAFLDRLFVLGFGQYFAHPVCSEKYYVGPNSLVEKIPGKFAISSAFIELDTKCNLNCVFCKEGDDVLFRRTGCKRWVLSNRTLGTDDWKRVIDQLVKLGARQIIFTGGEPFLAIERLEALIPYARRLGIDKLVIFTNGSILTSRILNLLSKYQVELNVQILGCTNDTYEAITGASDTHTAVSRNVALLANESISYSLTFLTNRFNEMEIERAYQEYGEFTSPLKMHLDHIYPVPSNDYYSEKYVDAMYEKKALLKKVDVNAYCYAQKRHTCFGRQLAVTADGRVLPCIMARNLVLGNISDNDMLYSLLRDSKYFMYRGLTKDKISGCGDCAFRYGCFDCRALEMSASGELAGLEYCTLKSTNRTGSPVEVK